MSSVASSAARVVAELLAHLARGLHVEVVALELEPVGVGDLRPGLDAQQGVVGLGVLGVGVVRVVGDDRAQAELRRASRAAARCALLLDAVVLELDEEALGGVDVLEVAQDRRAPRLVALEQVLVDLGAEAAGEHDHALAVLGEQLLVDPRLVPVALEVGPGRQRDEVAVAGVVGGQRGEVVVALLAVGAAELLVAPRPDRLVELGAEDRLDARALPGPEEVDQPEQHPVVGDRDRGLPVARDVSTSSSMREAPSSIEYSVCTCRWTKLSHGTSPVLALGSAVSSAATSSRPHAPPSGGGAATGGRAHRRRRGPLVRRPTGV
jgi:hypothetical protein